MDTREKWISAAGVSGLLAQGNWVIAAGLFDPLTAEVAQHLADLAGQHPDRQVLAFVLHSDSAHLPAAARAALIGALRSVSRVVVGEAKDLPGPCDRVVVWTDAALDRKQTQAFVDLVLRKQRVVEKAACS